MISSFLTRLFKTSGSIQRTLRLVEWTILLFYYLMLWITPYGEFRSPKILIFLLLFIFSILSWIFPINRPQWQRRIYIGAELILILIARSGGWNLELILYLVILKSCFLFKQKETIITTILSGTGWITLLAWVIPNNNYIQDQNTAGVLYDNMTFITYYQYFNETVSYTAVSIFILSFGFLMVKENQSQQQIKLLNREVETLGTLVDRTRIARNIHDTLGHTLTALGIQLEVAQQICLSHPEKIAPRLDTAKNLTDQCLQDIRNVVKALRHNDFDLAQGLTGLMVHLRQTQSLTTQTQLNLPALSLQTSYQIYCIIQEGITNIQKHADASHVSLRSSLSEKLLTIELSDNGNGFDLAKSTAGFGLQGMRERLQLIGGVLQVRTAESEGTQLYLEIPYDRETQLL
jgi:signal transduction histidine kinase